jgi:hypothetical protein
MKIMRAVLSAEMLGARLFFSLSGGADVCPGEKLSVWHAVNIF